MGRRRSGRSAAALAAALYLAATQPAPLAAQQAGSGSGDGALNLFLAGDAIITQPWSDDRDPGFLALVDAIRSADAAIVNLELVLHAYGGHAQADSGGGWLSGRPAIARELAWAGVDMVAAANNHAFDWGSGGVLENLTSVREAGLALAGTGKDLQDARASAFVRRPDGVVGLVSTASTFTPYGRASRSRPDVPGRPGLNPLTITPHRHVAVPPGFAQALLGTAGLAGLPHRRLDAEWFDLLGLRFRATAGFGPRGGWRVDPDDLAANLGALERAVAGSELAVFSIHAHQQGPWLTELAHRVIDAGADLFFAHGPHRMTGLEVYRGKLIIYGLGNFVFQGEQSERFPAEMYDRNGLGDDAGPEDVRRAALAREGSFWHQREPWESVAALVRFEAGALREVRLLPLELRRDAEPPVRGRPRQASPAVGRRIIDEMGAIAGRYGTRVRYVEAENAGVVELEGGDDLRVSSRRAAGPGR